MTFAYHEGHDVLRDVSFRIEPGEVVGMIGPSGSGKSTLVQLLLGLREPASGRIAVGGVDLREIERRSWTARTAFVAQEAIMVSGTVADNIAFFRDGIDARAHRAGGPPSAHRRRGRSDAERIRHRGRPPRRSAVGWAASATLHRQGAGG